MASRLLGSLEGEYGGLVLPWKPVGTSNLPRILFACCIPLDIFFVGRAVAGGGQLLSGGIHFATKVAMLPSFSPRTTRWSWLGSCTLWRGQFPGKKMVDNVELLFGCCVFFRWLFFRPGIAKSRPVKSGQRGGGDLPANFLR